LTIHKDRKIEEDVAYRIRAGLIKWRSACRRALCDCRIPVKLKEKIYRITIRPPMLYGMECWVLNKQNKMSVAENRMVRWMWTKTRKDNVKKWSYLFKGGRSGSY